MQRTMINVSLNVYAILVLVQRIGQLKPLVMYNKVTEIYLYSQ